MIHAAIGELGKVAMEHQRRLRRENFINDPAGTVEEALLSSTLEAVKCFAGDKINVKKDYYRYIATFNGAMLSWLQVCGDWRGCLDSIDVIQLVEACFPSLMPVFNDEWSASDDAPFDRFWEYGREFFRTMCDQQILEMEKYTHQEPEPDDAQRVQEDITRVIDALLSLVARLSHHRRTAYAYLHKMLLNINDRIMVRIQSRMHVLKRCHAHSTVIQLLKEIQEGTSRYAMRAADGPHSKYRRIN